MDTSNYTPATVSVASLTISLEALNSQQDILTQQCTTFAHSQDVAALPIALLLMCSGWELEILEQIKASMGSLETMSASDQQKLTSSKDDLALAYGVLADIFVQAIGRFQNQAKSVPKDMHVQNSGTILAEISDIEKQLAETSPAQFLAPKNDQEAQVAAGVICIVGDHAIELCQFSRRDRFSFADFEGSRHAQQVVPMAEQLTAELPPEARTQGETFAAEACLETIKTLKAEVDSAAQALLKAIK